MVWEQPGDAEESIILLEVWAAGGVLQTDNARPVGSSVTFLTGTANVPGRITACVQDDYGYVIEFSVESRGNWFPASYRPAYLMPKSSVPDESQHDESHKDEART